MGRRASALKPGRIPCCVPHCGRTRADNSWASEYVCGQHWRAVSKIRRRVYCRAVRLWRRGHAPRATMVRLWRRIKREAIERAVGL